MKTKIVSSREARVPGVRFCHGADCAVHREAYFTCTPLALQTAFRRADNLVCGVLEGWHHVPRFCTLETHSDAETFVFTQGTALMPFCDIVNGIPDLATVQIVRIEAGTQVEVAAGKGHFVAVAEGDHFCALVYCPQQPAERIALAQPIEA